MTKKNWIKNTLDLSVLFFTTAYKSTLYLKIKSLIKERELRPFLSSDVFSFWP